MLELTVDAVLFDSDGVLVDSHAQVREAWTAVAAEFALDFAALTPELAGVPAAQTLAQHLDGQRLSRAVARLEDLEVERAVDTAAIPGAASVVNSIPGDRWAIVTSASRRLALARWTAAGIPAPDSTITADDVTRGKPDPEPYLAGAAALGRDPARCLVLEDSRAGGASGAAAGARVLAVGSAEWDTTPVARVSDLREILVAADDGVLRVRIA
ncbi:HAD-IA family hydrolase [Euzebya tangerina]|uniref:HAD-IA family hydrolase n=1 Tax=Euzebya tangerina TaxID=591198 RepID=UPI0013C2FD0A|nr:HAD-IA family hydrolase [Euzebya tangerina]